jgi:1-acyl-sn-glycerol-3-phosphate acyltransferase
VRFVIPFFYWTGWLYCKLLAWVYGKVEVIGTENIPKKGGLIVACNHLNNADPGLIGVSFHRRFAFMAKAEMFEWPGFGGYVRLLGAFPVRRFEADLAALRKASELLQRGLALMMFPEGTRSKTGTMAQGHPGTAILALRTNGPILPVAITGTEVVKMPAAFFRPFRRTKVRIVIGKPFYLPPVSRIKTDVVEQGTEIIMTRIAALLPESYRGYYRDRVPAEFEEEARELQGV